MITHSLRDWIGLSLVTGTGGAGAVYYVLSVISDTVARRWPVVTGTVQSSRIEKVRSRFGSIYKLHIEYTYPVAGITYSSDQRRFDDDDYAYKSATSRLARYPVGAQVPVFYDPRDPSSSVLEPYPELQTYASIVFLSVMFVLGLGALIGYIH